MQKNVIIKPSDFKDFCSKLKPIWSLDTECTSLNWLDLKMIGFSIYDGVQACYVDIKPKHKKELLMILDYYIQEAKMVVFHNFPFDGMVLKKEGIEI